MEQGGYKIVIMHNLGEGGRVLSASVCRDDAQGELIMPRDALPEGNISQYRYVDGRVCVRPEAGAGADAGATDAGGAHCRAGAAE